MFQLYKNIQPDFLGQIFLELFQLKLGHFFGTPCISVKFRGIEEDIGISKPTTSHLRISYRSRDI